ncbi:MAG: hypothetical protein Q7W30_06000 [Coriobacteriia bacterium]|nr:hypothetical protein [Coriobacteriia bacterium]
MSTILAAILMIGGPVGAIIFVVGAAALISYMVYDVVSTRQRVKPAKEFSPEAAEARIVLERGVARAFVIAGGAFWGATAFAGLYWFQQTGMRAAFVAAAIPLLGAAATLAVGWYWERVASVMLAVASGAAIYWGVAAGFEAGVWALVTIALIGPMLTASALFWMARREQEAYELSMALQPEPALAATNR